MAGWCSFAPIGQARLPYGRSVTKCSPGQRVASLNCWSAPRGESFELEAPLGCERGMGLISMSPKKKGMRPIWPKTVDASHQKGNWGQLKRDLNQLKFRVAQILGLIRPDHMAQRDFRGLHQELGGWPCNQRGWFENSQNGESENQLRIFHFLRIRFGFDWG